MRLNDLRKRQINGGANETELGTATNECESEYLWVQRATADTLTRPLIQLVAVFINILNGQPAEGGGRHAGLASILGDTTVWHTQRMSNFFLPRK